MKRVLNTILNSLFRGAMRLFMPDLARQMQEEGTFSLDPSAGKQPPHMLVEDNGADLTLFVFSGLDVLYAGLARFEFQQAMRNLGQRANLVFLRDIHRMCFHLTPEGQPGGLAFYAREIEAVQERLGARHNVAIGSSIGGTAAFHFATRCRMEHAVVFGAVLDWEQYIARRTSLRTIFDVKKLLREPRAYFEVLVVTLSAMWAKRHVSKRMSLDEAMRPLEQFRESAQRPAVTMFYGETAWADANQAASLKQAEPSARLLPLPTGRHNTPAFLKQRGELAARLGEAIAAGVPAQDPVAAPLVVETPPAPALQQV